MKRKNNSYIGVFLIGCLFVSCNYSQHTKSIKKDTQRIFAEKKEMFINIGFKAVVEEKNTCVKCELNKYTLLLRIIDISKKPEFRHQQYPPYYSFENDSLLTISVAKGLYDEVNTQDTLIKISKSLNFNVDLKEIRYLSETEYKWFFNQ